MRPNSLIPHVFKPFPALFALLAAGLVLSTGCSGAEEQTDPIINAYEVRGVITALPSPGPPSSELMIQHEAIPDFVGKSGDIVGMETMKMPFPLEPSVDLSGYAVGDPVVFSFVVTWGGVDSGWQLTAIEKLPGDTVLNLSEAAHESGHADHDPHAGHNH